MQAERSVSNLGRQVSEGEVAWPKTAEVGGGQRVQNLMCSMKEFCFDSQGCEKP